jgi:hypothetical protein
MKMRTCTIAGTAHQPYYTLNSSVLAWGNNILIAMVSIKVGINAIINNRIRIIYQYFFIKLAADNDIFTIVTGSAINIYLL